MMPNMDWEQLEALKRQLEEDYRMDIAAIERLQRRFKAANGGGSTAMPTPAMPSVVHNVSVMETPSPVAPKSEPSSQGDADELTNSLRSMFSTYRK